MYITKNVELEGEYDYQNSDIRTDIVNISDALLLGLFQYLYIGDA